jgi:hypothetical protein
MALERFGSAGGAAFPSTRHSVIERLRTGEPEVRRDAFGDLFEGYWRPVYTHLRLTRKLTPDDAQDVTQGFFASAFEKGWFDSFEPEKARFRTFVRVCADRYLQNHWQAAARLKRGGGATTVPLDFDGAERITLARLASPLPDPDTLFHQEFVRALFERTVDEVRRECSERGRAAAFELFERYDLAPAEGDSYATLARERGLTTAQVTNMLAQVRRRFRERALESLHGLCGSDDDFRRDARDLFGVDVA